MGEEYVFHIRNASPGDMLAALATLDAYPGTPSIAEIVARAQRLGFVIRDQQRLEALMTARDLGLVERDDNILTADGRVLVQIEMAKPDLFVDLVHGLQYVLWDKQNPGADCFSWSYRVLCQILWQGGNTDLEDRRALAAAVEGRARSTFGRPEISFSPKSVGGAILWLSELSPPVLEGAHFARRSFCPPELFVLALDFVYRSDEIDYGANLRLTEERRDEVCQVCLLDPRGFDRVLDYAQAQFDFLERGVGGGWGRYIALQRPPRLEDFL
ncbi:MAG: hypothetical protein ONB06_05200 [candidate division KSB1 bacterium]|nr:hypothetical protein [candidate division KSB1 bacterium]